MYPVFPIHSSLACWLGWPDKVSAFLPSTKMMKKPGKQNKWNPNPNNTSLHLSHGPSITPCGNSPLGQKSKATFEITKGNIIGPFMKSELWGACRPSQCFWDSRRRKGGAPAAGSPAPRAVARGPPAACKAGVAH